MNPIPARFKPYVHFGTSENMDSLPDASVQAVICSPPYWDRKDYGHPDQIGFGESYKEYHSRMDRVWAECLRAVRPDGTLWVVVDKVWHDGILVDIPYDIAVHCQEMGWFLQDLVVWNKPTAIAGMNDRNLVNKYEIVVVLSKSKGAQARFFNAPNDGPTPDVHRQTGRITDFWRISVKAGSLRKTPDHEAPYPIELMERIIELSTKAGDVVLDPFLGSGTTMEVAFRLGRKCHGYEINPAFAKLIGHRLEGLPVHEQALLPAVA